MLIKRRPGRPRAAECDPTAFDVLTKEASYWLGLIFADGGVAGSRLSLGLSSPDAEHVASFATFIRMEPSILRRSRNQVIVSVTSDVLVAVLRDKWGIIPRKTWCARAPDELVASRDFWRGFVDGDGYVSKYSERCTGHPRLGSAAVGVISHDGSTLVDQFAAFAHGNGIASSVQVEIMAGQSQSLINGVERDYSGRRYKRWKAQGEQAIALMRLLYDGADLALPRKAAIVRQWLDAPRDNRDGFRYFETVDKATSSSEARVWSRMGRDPFLRAFYRARRERGMSKKDALGPLLEKSTPGPTVRGE